MLAPACSAVASLKIRNDRYVNDTGTVTCLVKPSRFANLVLPELKDVAVDHYSPYIVFYIHSTIDIRLNSETGDGKSSPNHSVSANGFDFIRR